jgi:hypothetical protein
MAVCPALVNVARFPSGVASGMEYHAVAPSTNAVPIHGQKWCAIATLVRTTRIIRVSCVNQIIPALPRRRLTISNPKAPP